MVLSESDDCCSPLFSTLEEEIMGSGELGSTSGGLSSSALLPAREVQQPMIEMPIYICGTKWVWSNIILVTPTVMSSSREVLSLYRRILSLARVWRATVESDSVIESKYIKEEARRLFRKNKDVSNDLKF